MMTLLIAIGAGLGFVLAYHTYGHWLGSRVFNLSSTFVCPSHRLNDGKDYVPTKRPIVFGHHFTSIAGTGPIVGPAIAVMWGWLPALLWVILGSIFIGAVHDFGALVVSLRNDGQTVGEIAGRLINKRVRILFLLVLFMALTIVLAIFGLVIAAVFEMYPVAIFPCAIQIPIAILIGLYLHRKGVDLTIPSLIALAVMYLAVIYGNYGWLGEINTELSKLSTITWVAILLIYSYIASVLPVWTLLQPRDYINSLQLLTTLGLVVVGLCYAAFAGGAPPVEGAVRQPLEIVAPMFKWEPSDAPIIFPFLFITIACGAISGFHCLVSSGTSSKQLEKEPDAKFVGYGSMLTEGFLAVIVILACVAGLGLGGVVQSPPNNPPGTGIFEIVDHSGSKALVTVLDGKISLVRDYWIIPPAFGKNRVELITNGESDLGTIREGESRLLVGDEIWITNNSAGLHITSTGVASWHTRYQSWKAAGGLSAKIGAFVDGSANFLKSIGISSGIALALMGVLVASFAGTTLDTACRLQRYVVQELASTFLPKRGAKDCFECGYDLTGNVSGKCSECGWKIDWSQKTKRAGPPVPALLRPFVWLTNKHVATLFAIVIGFLIAAMPTAGNTWSWENAGKGGMILWPMFGATNQLLGGLAFMVIAFYLWRRKKPIWFLVLPLIFMLVMPAWAMLYLLPEWLAADTKNWPLIVIAAATLLLEVWMVLEAVLMWPRVKGVLETQIKVQ